MARPERRDVDYFPFRVKEGKTLFILESKYQCKGTGFFTNVLRFLSRTDNHYISIKDEADKLFFFSTVKCDEESGMDMLNIMAATGKIHRGLWENFMVIVSEDFIESIQDAYKKRNNDCITIEQILEQFQVSEGINPVKVAENEIKCGSNPQIKVKESKEKKRKEMRARENDEKSPDEIYSFVDFWEAYPHRGIPEGKYLCKQWFSSFEGIENETRERLKIGTANYKAYHSQPVKEGDFRPRPLNPINFLREKRYEDFVDIPEPGKPKSRPIRTKMMPLPMNKVMTCECGGLIKDEHTYEGQVFRSSRLVCEKCGQSPNMKGVKEKVLESLGEIG